jgi:geranylgeranyl pyrophosphate synthase
MRAMSEAKTAMSDPTGSFADWVSAVQHRTETALDRFLPPATIAPARLHDAMRYAVLGGGKRVRPAAVPRGRRAVRRFGPKPWTPPPAQSK